MYALKEFGDQENSGSIAETAAKQKDSRS